MHLPCSLHGTLALQCRRSTAALPGLHTCLVVCLAGPGPGQSIMALRKWLGFGPRLKAPSAWTVCNRAVTCLFGPSSPSPLFTACACRARSTTLPRPRRRASQWRTASCSASRPWCPTLSSGASRHSGRRGWRSCSTLRGWVGHGRACACAPAGAARHVAVSYGGFAMCGVYAIPATCFGGPGAFLTAFPTHLMTFRCWRRRCR